MNPKSEVCVKKARPHPGPLPRGEGDKVSAFWPNESTGLALVQGFNVRIVRRNFSPTNGLVEALAKIEHQQWMHWSRSVASQVPPTTLKKWKISWVDYNKLTDDLKEADRVWARKVMTLLRRRRLIQ